MVLCLSALCAHAQENTSRQIYQQAESEYGIGRIDQAIQLLQGHLDDFEGNLKQSAYRLLALCYLSEDRDDEARCYAEKLVKLNNYYNSAEDPARFQELVNQLKEGMGTSITTASSQSESVNEAPVPITIITAEMIEEMGYNKNLNQILAAYVPGMEEVLSLYEGVNMMTHSAYADAQEFILVMENGHRLNTRFENSGSLDYSISTEKIDHIEVLRGPASSLYGNVALSAVVNIITKSGRDLDGVKAKYGYATFNTHKADLTAGTQFLDADIFAWASIYNSDGQIRHFGDGEGYLKDYLSALEDYGTFRRTYLGSDNLYISGYKDTPAYDVGFTFKYKGFDLMFSKKNVKKVQRQCSSYCGYEYQSYYAINGVKPGKGSESTHAEIAYSRQLGRFYLNASVYSDWYDIFDYEVITDSIVSELAEIDDEGQIILDERGHYKYTVTEETGQIDFSFYKEHTMGGSMKASTDYTLGNMKGNILVGDQFEVFSLKSANRLWGRKDGRIDSGELAYDDLFHYGKEKILSFFVQDKHYFMPKLILNGGLRFDLKYRQDEKVVKTFSPRLALMFVPNDRFSLKLSFSEAFADLSFYYRYISKFSFPNFDPQHLSAMQLTAMGTISPLHISYEANIFYNKYDNLLCWQERRAKELLNGGTLRNAGFEGTVNYAHKRLSAYLSLYYCKDISSDHYYYDNIKEMVCNVPHFTFNLHGAWKALQHGQHEIKIYGHSKYIGKRLNYSFEEEDDFFVDGKLLFDVGAKYMYNQRLQISLDCENIFDTVFYICGPNNHHAPHFQRGRNLMAAVSYRF